MPRTRCDEVVVQIIVRTYDTHDRPIGEAMSQPTKVFRSQALDFWRHVDTLIAGQTSPRAQPPAPALKVVEPKKRRKGSSS